MHIRLSRGITAVVALSLVAAGCGVTGAVSNVAALCAAAAFNVKVILGRSSGVFSGQPAAGVNVILQPTGGAATTKTTDAQGCAGFDSAPGGTYEVSAVPPSQLPAAAQTIRDLNVSETGREIVLILPHRLPSNAVPPRVPAGGATFSVTMTGTLNNASGPPQSGTPCGGMGQPTCAYAPGFVGIVAFGGTGLCATCTDITDGAGNWSLARTGMSTDRPAVTQTLFGGNWDGTTPGGLFGVRTEHFTQYAYQAAVNLFAPGPLAFGTLTMGMVTGSQATSLDAQGAAFVASFADGFSITDVFLYSAIHSADLWLATVYHDSGVTAVTTPFPQIALDQSIYRYGMGIAGSLSGGVFGQTTTFLVTGAPTLNISYLPQPGDPVVGAGSQPTVTWTASSGATAYEIDIFNSLGQLVWFGATSTSLSITLPMALAAGSYSVQVFAFDSFTARDFIGAGSRAESVNAAARPIGSVLRAKDFKVQGLRSNRREATKQVQALMSNFRPGGPLRRPQLDQTPLSNNDDRVSFSNEIAFTR
ncbi:MAG: hypothetical protein ACRDF1_07615 [bacterium]